MIFLPKRKKARRNERESLVICYKGRTMGVLSRNQKRVYSSIEGEKMKLTSRNWLILSTTVVILGLSGVYLDFFLSLNAYNVNPEHFIKYEVNREIVDFFMKSSGLTL